MTLPHEIVRLEGMSDYRGFTAYVCSPVAMVPDVGLVPDAGLVAVGLTGVGDVTKQRKSEE